MTDAKPENRDPCGLGQSRPVRSPVGATLDDIAARVLDPALCPRSRATKMRTARVAKGSFAVATLLLASSTATVSAQSTTVDGSLDAGPTGQGSCTASGVRPGLGSHCPSSPTD